MTIKIFVDTQAEPEKSLKIMWNEEFNQLFELGIIEKSKELGQFGGGGSGSSGGFNGKKNRGHPFEYIDGWEGGVKNLTGAKTSPLILSLKVLIIAMSLAGGALSEGGSYHRE